jgi:hypothetical protein
MGFLYDLYKIYTLIPLTPTKRDFLPWNQYKLKKNKYLRGSSRISKKEESAMPKVYRKMQFFISR